MFESLSDRLGGIFSGLKGKGRLTEDDINSAMREIRLALLEADVNFKVVKDFVNVTKEQCLKAEILDSLTPAQNVTKVVLDQLTKLLGEEDAKLDIGNKSPHIIMLVGLQGSGKTTAAAKLAYLLKKQNHSPLLVACDIYRPAAADQLQSLADDIDVMVYRDKLSENGSGSGKTAVQIAEEGVKAAVDNLRDVVIVDTAGRLHVDEEMMNEAKNIKQATKADSTLMVVDAMTGQDAVNVAKSFADQVDFDGVIMSKMDGDARGGGALSIKEVTGKPIIYVSSGEKPDSLEEFHPDRMAKRILGMGDVVSLIESAVEQEQQEIEEEQAERMLQAKLTLDDFITMNKQIGKMGGIGKIMESMPGNMKQGEVDEHVMDNMVVIINSMTKEERIKPEILNGSRRSRIAAGAGVKVQDVNILIQRFNQTKKMLKKLIPNFEQVPVNTSNRRKKGKKGKKNKKKRGMMGIPGLQNMSPSQMMELKKNLEEMQKNKE